MGKGQLLDKTKQSLETRIITTGIVIFLCLQLIFQFLNEEQYFLLSGFYLPLLGVCILGIMLTIKKINHFNGNTILAIILLMIVLLNCVLHPQHIDRGYLLTYILTFTVFFVFSLMELSHNQLKIVQFGYVLSGVIISLLMILFRVRYYELDPTRITINVFGNQKIDPNYLAGFLVAPFFLAVKGWLEGEKSLQKIFYFIASVMIVFAVFLTGSRGSFLAVIVGVITILLNAKIKLSEKRMKFILLISGFVIIGAILLVSFVIPQETISRIFDVNNWVDSSNSRRIALWENALIAIFKSPFLGLGIYPTAQLIGQVTGEFSPAHCTYLEVWIQIGIVGVIAIVFLAITSFYKNKNPYMRAIIVSTVVVAIFISAEANFFFWLNLILPIMFKKEKMEKQEAKL